MKITRPSGSVYADVYIKDEWLCIACANLNGVVFQLDKKTIPQLIEILRKLQEENEVTQ